MAILTYNQAMAKEASNLVAYMLANGLCEEKEVNGKTSFYHDGVALVVCGVNGEARFCHLLEISDKITPYTQKRARMLAGLCKAANTWKAQVKARKEANRPTQEDLLAFLKANM